MACVTSRQVWKEKMRVRNRKGTELLEANPQYVVLNPWKPREMAELVRKR